MKNQISIIVNKILILFILNLMMSCSDRQSDPSPPEGQSSDVRIDEKDNTNPKTTSEPPVIDSDSKNPPSTTVPPKSPTKRLSPEMKTTNPTNSNNEQEIPIEVDAEFKQSSLYKEASSTVLDQSSLPGMGMLHFSDKSVSEEIYRCNVFLVGKDLVITNAHCVLKLKQNSSCQGKFLFNIKMKEGSELRGCKKIIEISKYNEEKNQIPDYAIIQLDSPLNIEQTHQFTIARDGMLPKNNFTIHSYDIDSDTYKYVFGKYKKSNCSLVMHSFLTNYHDEKLPFESISESNNLKGGRSLVVNFANLNENDHCHIIEGNSGSPVLNSKGEVVGIHSGTSIKEKFLETKNKMELEHDIELSNINSIPRFDHLKISSTYQPLYFVSNFTCLKFQDKSLNTSYNPKWCDEFVKEEKNPKGEVVIPNYEKQTIEYINYTINTLVDIKIKTYLNPIMQKSFPGIQFNYGRTNLGEAQRMAETFNLSGLSKQKDYLVVSPKCKDKNFSPPDFTMEVPIYQISYDDVFDSFFRYTREPIISEINVNYLRSTANLSLCTD